MLVERRICMMKLVAAVLVPALVGCGPSRPELATRLSLAWSDGTAAVAVTAAKARTALSAFEADPSTPPQRVDPRASDEYVRFVKAMTELAPYFEAEPTRASRVGQRATPTAAAKDPALVRQWEALRRLELFVDEPFLIDAFADAAQVRRNLELAEDRARSIEADWQAATAAYQAGR